MVMQIYIPPAGMAQNPEVLRQFRMVDDYLGSFSSVTAAGTISSAFTVVSSASANTQTLPSAVESKGRGYTIKNRGVGVVTVSPVGSQTIDGKTAAHLNKNGCVVLASDGTNWVVLSILSAAYT